jgi:hypothetical protein
MKTRTALTVALPLLALAIYAVLQRLSPPALISLVDSISLNSGNTDNRVGTNTAVDKTQNIDICSKRVENGQTLSEVIEILGEPQGRVELKEQGKLLLYYVGSQKIELMNGRVVNLPADFLENLKRAVREKAEIENALQKEKQEETQTERSRKPTNLLVNSKPPQKPSVQKKGNAVTQALGPGYIVLRRDGSLVDHKPLAIPGKVAIWKFKLKGGSSCPSGDRAIQEFVRSDDKIVFKSIEFTSWDDPIIDRWALSRNWNMTIRVVDSEGRVMGPNTFAVNRLAEYVARAKKGTNIP